MNIRERRIVNRFNKLMKDKSLKLKAVMFATMLKETQGTVGVASGFMLHEDINAVYYVPSKINPNILVSSKSESAATHEKK